MRTRTKPWVRANAILGANENDDDDEKTENAYLARFPGLKPLYVAKKNADRQQRIQTRTCMTLTVYSLMMLFSGKPPV